MSTSIPKNQKTRCSLGYFWVNNWKNKTLESKLKRIPCIQYLVIFTGKTEALRDSKSQINTISQAFASELGFKIQITDVGVQKIDSNTLETYEIVVSIFSVLNKDSRKRFFEEIFLLANVKPDIVLDMHFLTIGNADIDFQAQNLQ